MLRVKKMTDAIFPRDFSETIKAYNKYYHERELFVIKNHYDRQLHKLQSVPNEYGYSQGNTEESIIFQKKYEGHYEEYAKDFNLPFHPLNEIHCSNYAVLIEIYYNSGKKSTFSIIVANKSMNLRGKIHLLDINEEELIANENQAIMYSPRINECGVAFFLYKKCLYKAEFNEFFTDEELILKVKEKLYKEDKKFEQLKKQIELYENSDLSDTSKKKSREPIPEDVKFEVWRRDQGRCVICGSQENLEFDHIIPVSKGGSSTARNIQLLCQNCNRHKSDKI